MKHAHHFIIETPNGPTSKGICKYCGKEQIFTNFMGTRDLKRFDNSKRMKEEPGYEIGLEKVLLGS